jgi:allophanate hydrolase subunit 2
LPSFFNQIFTVSSASDRMGVRLQGQALVMPALNMVSEGLWVGAVQLPPDGQPIVMLRDHQTMGGYPKLGSICRQSQALLAQALPGDSCQFQAINADQALQKARQHEQHLQSLEQQLWAERDSLSIIRT